MNGRLSKLLRKTFSPEESPAKRSSYRRFKKAYNSTSKDQKAEVRRVATKVKDARGKGQEVREFRINPETHQAEAVERGVADERQNRTIDTHGVASGRKRANKKESNDITKHGRDKSA